MPMQGSTFGGWKGRICPSTHLRGTCSTHGPCDLDPLSVSCRTQVVTIPVCVQIAPCFLPFLSLCICFKSLTGASKQSARLSSTMMRRFFAVVASLLLAVAAETAERTTFELEECPPCEDLFLKLEAGADGRLSQVIEMQERGEPKSGTSMMGLWAREALQSACDFLQSTYGRETCNITHNPETVNLLFDPQAGLNNGACPCDTVDRVSIFLDMTQKHELPVEETCPWWHTDSISWDSNACRPLDGKPVRSLTDLWSCVEDSACELTDSRLQFVPLRDPRPMTVSAYFHLKKYHPAVLGNATVDEYFLSNLALTCQWVALRHIVFEGLMASTSEVFWYEEATVDAMAWHLRWTKFAGLQLPATLLESMAQADEAAAKSTMNEHIGGKKRRKKRTWKDEVGAEVVDVADGIVRSWLPPVLLARWGITG
ncbi:unnamed protein product [Scytosiphon promiscuus]